MDERTKEIMSDYEKWFAKHRARLLPAGKLQRLSWFEPGTSTMGIEYVLLPENGTLHVAGDLGFASYCWYSKDVTFPWLAELNLDYFASKCVASGVGRRYREWDEDTARRYLKEFFISEELTSAQLKWWSENQEDALGAAYDKDEWLLWLTLNLYDSGPPIETECLSGLAVCGLVTAGRCIAHWYGLKLAMKQLEAE